MPEQVICMDAKNQAMDLIDRVERGKIYTIRQSRHHKGADEPGYLLHEIRTGIVFKDDGAEIGWRQDRFQPINDDAIEIFRKMARKTPKREGANA